MIKLSLLQLGFLALNIFMHLSMVCPRMGVAGQPTGHLTFSVSKCQFPHPWVSILGSNSHPWGELIGTHNSCYCSTERLQTVIITW